MSALRVISGNYFPIKIEVMKIRRLGDNGNRVEDQYIFFFENRPLRTLYKMKDDARIKFEKQDLDYHFQLFYESLKDMLRENEEISFSYFSLTINFDKVYCIQKVLLLSL